MKIRNLYALTAATLLSGCFNPNMASPPQVPMYCTAGDDCEVKWGKAMQWLQANSTYKLRNVTDFLITTEGPLPRSPDSAFTISKVALGKGNYQITFSSACDNIFGCIPSSQELAASFHNTVDPQPTALAPALSTTITVPR